MPRPILQVVQQMPGPILQVVEQEVRKKNFDLKDGVVGRREIYNVDYNFGVVSHRDEGC